MTLLLYLAFLALGLWLGYLFKVFFSGPNITYPKLLFCYLFNGFVGSIHIGLVSREYLLFVGDVSSWVDDYPLVLWPALIGALVQAALFPTRTR
ncbi:hypothetical protein N5D52_08965, partial [Pseudomonas sp. GD03860]